MKPETLRQNMKSPRPHVRVGRSSPSRSPCVNCIWYSHPIVSLQNYVLQHSRDDVSKMLHPFRGAHLVSCFEHRKMQLTGQNCANRAGWSHRFVEFHNDHRARVRLSRHVSCEASLCVEQRSKQRLRHSNQQKTIINPFQQHLSTSLYVRMSIVWYSRCPVFQGRTVRNGGGA